MSTPGEPLSIRFRGRALAVALVLAACCLLGAVAAASAGAAPPLVGDWPLESSSEAGGVQYTPDVSGNGLALASPNPIPFGTELGKFGGYLASTNTTPLQVTSPLLAPPQVTVLAWIKQGGYPGALRYIAGRGDDGPTCGGSSYALYTGYNALPGLHFYVRQPGSEAVPVVSDAAPESVFDGNWHLVAGTYDGTDIRLYVDGVQVGPAKPASGINYEAPITDPPFYADGYPPQAGCSGASDFPGQIDELRVYSRALSPTELGRLAAAPGPEAPTLVPDEGAPGSPGGPGSPTPPPIGPQPGPLGLLLKRPDPTANTHLTVLKIDATGPVTETRIKIDGSPAFHVDPSAPYVGINLSTIGTHTVTATTFGIGGATVTKTTPITITPAPGQLRPPRFNPETAILGPSYEALIEAAKNSQCVPDSTVIFGIAEAHGCFRKIDPVTELPAAEKAVAEEYTAVNFFIEHSGPRPCKFGDKTCSTNFASAFRQDPAIQPFVSTQPVKINGMTVTPVGSATVLVFPAIQRIISANANITYDGSVFGSIPVQSGPLNLDLSSSVERFTSGNERLKLFSFDTSKTFDDIGGFPINGQVNIAFKKTGEARTTALEVNLSLPEQISTAAGADPTAKVEVNADNERGTYLGFLNIHMNEAFLGPVELANVDFTYNDAGEPAENCPRKWWKATAEVFFLPGESEEEGAGLKMAPEPNRNGISFCAGDFHSAGADLKFGYPIPPPEIFPGVTLNEIGFSIQVDHPVVFDGFAKIKSAELITATGGFLAAFASQEYPYTFQPGDAGGALNLLHGKTFTSTTVAIGGKVEIEASEDVQLELGSAYLLYSYPDYISAKGSAHLQTFLFAINAEAAFELSTTTRKFNTLLKGEVCLAGGIKIAGVGACAGGEARVSSRGLSVCFNFADESWTPGVGYVYGASTPEFFAGTLGDGCKPSHFWVENVRSPQAATLVSQVDPVASASAAGAMTFTVKPGETVKNVELVGGGGAPAVTVKAPNGETLASEPNLMRHGKRLSLINSERFSRTWIGVENAVPGVYTVTPQPGSPPITSVRATRPEPDAKVTASVSGSGRHLVLDYDAGHAKNQRVSFYERGKSTWELLKTVSGGKGKLAFEPSFGPAGTRSVAAQVEVDGIPAPLETLDHFKAPPPPKAGTVTGVRVVRHGSKLAVTWAKSPYAQKYAVVVEEAGGRVHSLSLKGAHSSVSVKHVPATEAGRVEVVSFGPLGDRGKPGVAKFKATAKKTTRSLPYGELGTGTVAKGAKKAKTKNASRA